MAAQLLKFISSLRLTVACLSLALVLVFAGTIAQVEHGLWDTQVRFFRSMFVYWRPTGGAFALPVLPGGYLLGWVLLINLLAAHYVRFKFAWSKLGIFMTHFGLIFLLLGQFLTEQFQVESSMRSRMERALKPPKMTECTAPMRAQASMATASSGAMPI